MTGVYYDLKQDKDFDEADYPLVRDNYSLKVIQIVEASNGSLFLYVYKPSGDTTDIVATKVLMSNTGTNDGLAYYDLELLSAEGVFHKYLIKGLERKEEYTRKYLIISIFRAWNEDYGDTTQEGTIGSSKAYPVEVIFTYKVGVDGKVTLSAEYTDDIITIIDECAGHIFYQNADYAYTYGKMSHYYAFSTNKPIASIKSAYLEFDIYQYSYNFAGVGSRPQENIVETTKEVVLTDTDITTLPTGDFWFEFWNLYEYDYPRINSTQAFLVQEGNDILTEEAEKAIEQQDWILRYYESEYTNYTGSSSSRYAYTDIKAIRMFRIEYWYNGKLYDVGVVADEVTQDNELDGVGGSISRWPESEDDDWWQKLVALLCLILLVVVLVFIYPITIPILKFVLQVLWLLFGAILEIVTYPFRLVFKQIFK